MKEVRIDRRTLLGKVKENRDKHKAEFEQALKDYRKAVVLDIEEKLEQAKKHEDIDWYRNRLHKPEDNTEDYDVVILMLEMSEDSEITLTQGEFRQFVMDEWSWKDTFRSASISNSAYLMSKA